jgi:hypothetical protein
MQRITMAPSPAFTRLEQMQVRGTKRVHVEGQLVRKVNQHVRFAFLAAVDVHTRGRHLRPRAAVAGFRAASKRTCAWSHGMCRKQKYAFGVLPAIRAARAVMYRNETHTNGSNGECTNKGLKQSNVVYGLVVLQL